MFKRFITFLFTYVLVVAVTLRLARLYLAIPRDKLFDYAKRTTGDHCEKGNSPSTQPPESTWLGWGAGIYNNRWANSNSPIRSETVASLLPSCGLRYGLGVSAAPFVENDVAYYPTHDGLLVALHYRTCAVLWQMNVSDIITSYKPVAANLKDIVQKMSRTTPVSDGDHLYIGTQANALLLAINKHSGKMLSILQISDHPAAILTQSPTFFRGTLFIGAASMEEMARIYDPDYPCCSFIGTMNAVIMTSKGLKLLWTVHMAPKASGWSGSSIWGSQPSIDRFRNQLFIATGNTYKAPTTFDDCRDQISNISGVTPIACLPSDVFQESVLALDIATGRVNWIKQLSPVDIWTIACPNPYINVTGSGSEDLCPNPGPDVDFAMAPTFIPGSNHTPYQIDTIVVGQKSGALYALSAMTGAILWKTITSPGGLTGGLSWGIAVDDRAVYYTAANSLQVSYSLPGSGVPIRNSAFGAVDLRDGHIIWQVAAPRGGSSQIAPTVVNDVILTGVTGTYTESAGNISRSGSIVALNKASGALLKEFSLGDWFGGGIAVVRDYILFGTGYSSIFPSSGSFHVWKLNS